MINLHAVGGIHPDSIKVVLAVHGGATRSILDNAVYLKKYHVNNPNLQLLDELCEAGVRITVCGQSLIGRGIDIREVYDKVEIATSMLTTVTTYQLKDFHLLKF